MLVTTPALLMCLPLVLVDLFAYLVGDGKHELGREPKVRAQALREVLRRVVRVVNVPFKLVSYHDVANPDIELNGLDQFTVHLLILPELCDLLFQLSHYFVLESPRNAVLLNQNPRKVLQVPVWLLLVPEELVSQPATFHLDVEFDWDQLQIWLACCACLVRASVRVLGGSVNTERVGHSVP